MTRKIPSSYRLIFLLSVLWLPAVSPASSTLDVLHGFSRDGEYSYAALLEDNDGRLYGTSEQGGANDLGTVFVQDADGSNYRILHSFSFANTDGRYPRAGLIEGSDGRLYGTTYTGGAYNRGTVFSLDPATKAHTLLHSFSGTGGQNPQARLLEGSDGRLYGTTYYGGESGYGTVFVLDKDGQNFTLRHSFSSAATDGRFPAGLIEGSDGRLYGTTFTGGAYNRGTVFVLDKDGQNFALRHSFSGTDGRNPQARLLEGSDGRLYGTTNQAGASGYGTVFVLDKDGQNFAVRHSFSSASSATTDGRFPRAGLIEGSDGRLYGTTEYGGANSRGTVFVLDKDGQNFDLRHSFSDAEGAYPIAGLIEGSDGRLYGTTYQGGANGYGTVFSLDPATKTHTLLHSLSESDLDGYNPYAGLVQGGDGLLYGTTYSGGAAGRGTVFSLDPATKTHTLLHSFSGSDGSNPWAGLVQDGNGLLYGTTYSGGAAGRGTVFSLDPATKTHTLLHSFSGSDGSNPQAGLVQDGNGLLYGTTYSGGASGVGTVFSLDPATKAHTLLHSFSGSDGSNPYAGLVQDGNGLLYGTTYSGGAAGRGTVFSLDPATKTHTLLHSFSGSDGSNPRAGLVQDGNGLLYGTTLYGGAQGGGTVFRLAEFFDFGDAPESSCNYPTTIPTCDGARHGTGVLFLGTLIDSEANGQSHANALGDNNTGDNDEDGIGFANLVIGATGTLNVAASQANGYINAWLDFDGNGNWTDIHDLIVNNEQMSATSEAFDFTVPDTISPVTTFARVRLSTAGGDNFTGEAADGEVEDYQVSIGYPTLSINDTSVTEGGDLTFTVTLSHQVSQTVTAKANTVDGSASTTDNDYTELFNEPITITAGNTEAQVTVPTGNDNKFEQNETLTVNLSNASGATLTGGDPSGTGTINDDDAVPTVQFGSASQSLGEGDAATNIAVSLSNPSYQQVSVPISISTDSAINGTDYATITGPILIPAGATGVNVGFDPTDDTLDEADETATFTMGTPTNAGLGSQKTHTVTINDNDDPPTVDFTAATNGVDEGVGSVTVTAQLSAASGKDVTVPLTFGGTATGADYSAGANQIVINAGDTQASVTLTITNDNLNEVDETVIVTMGSPTNAGQGTVTEHTLTIQDNDASPSVSFASVSQDASEEGGAITITVNLSAKSGQNVSVPYAVSGTATDPDDYSIDGSPLMIPAGDTSATITVTPASDTLDEATETVIVTLGTPPNADIGTEATHTVNLTDDDAAPTVSFDVATSTAGETAGTVNLIVSLSAVSGQTVTVPFSVTGGSAADPDDYGVAASPLVFAPGARSLGVSITPVADAIDEADESVEVTLGIATNAGLGTTQVHTLTITDNNDAPTVSFAADSQSIAEDGVSASVNLQLSAVSAKDVTVTFGVSGGDATVVDDFTLNTASPVTIPAGTPSVAVDLGIVDDAIDEADETTQLTISAATNAAVGAMPTHTLTIQDNDVTPVVTLSIDNATIAENGGVATVTASLNVIQVQPVTVDLDFGGTANGSDYSASATQIVIPAGDLTGSVAITSVDDGADEANETVMVGINGLTTGVVAGDPSQVQTTITDDDGEPTVTLSADNASMPENGGTIILTAALSNLSFQDVAVTLGTGGSATAGTDYTLGSTINIPAGSLTGTVTLTSIDDTTDEPNESILVEVTGVANATEAGIQQLSLGIVDDDSGPLDANAQTPGDQTISSGAKNVVMMTFGVRNNDSVDAFLNRIMFSISAANASPQDIGLIRVYLDTDGDKTLNGPDIQLLETANIPADGSIDETLANPYLIPGSNTVRFIVAVDYKDTITMMPATVLLAGGSLFLPFIGMVGLRRQRMRLMLVTICMGGMTIALTGCPGKSGGGSSSGTDSGTTTNTATTTPTVQSSGTYQAGSTSVNGTDVNGNPASLEVVDVSGGKVTVN